MSGKKEEILKAALTLFAQKGFEASSIDEIGAAIKMKGPALYHYFKGKDALLDALTDMLEEHFSAGFGTAENLRDCPQNMDEFIAQTQERLNFTLHDPLIKKARRMLTMEQFRNEKLVRLAGLHQLTSVERLNGIITKKLIENGSLKPGDSEMLAFEFTAPISVLVQFIEREPEREAEYMQRIRAHMEHFARVYGA